MEQELIRRLRAMNKEQLILLLEKLTERYVTLPTDIASILNVSAHHPKAGNTAPSNIADLALHHTAADSGIPPDLAPYRQRINSFSERLQQGEAEQTLLNELINLLERANTLRNQHHYLPALEMYELILDTRLSHEEVAIAAIFDRAIDAFLGELDLLLAEASSLMVINPGQLDIQTQLPVLTPQLSPTMRRNWLVRLFGLWLKRMEDLHIDEQILNMIRATMWSEDLPMFRQLILDTIASSPSHDHANIVDFSHQSRVRRLEKLLREFSSGS